MLEILTFNLYATVIRTESTSILVREFERMQKLRVMPYSSQQLILRFSLTYTFQGAMMTCTWQRHTVRLNYASAKPAGEAECIR